MRINRFTQEVAWLRDGQWRTQEDHHRAIDDRQRREAVSPEELQSIDFRPLSLSSGFGGRLKFRIHNGTGRRLQMIRAKVYLRAASAPGSAPWAEYAQIYPTCRVEPRSWADQSVNVYDLPDDLRGMVWTATLDAATAELPPDGR